MPFIFQKMSFFHSHEFFILTIAMSDCIFSSVIHMAYTIFLQNKKPPSIGFDPIHEDLHIFQIQFLDIILFLLCFDIFISFDLLLFG